MRIRPATTEDVKHIVRLFHETIRTINHAHYTPEQLHAWSPQVPDSGAWITNRLNSRMTFVAELLTTDKENSAIEKRGQGMIIGFIELERDGHIDCLYCHHHYQRQGVGASLLAHIEEKAREQGIPRLYTEASITAQPFFHANGFALVEERAASRNGVRLKNARMEKMLNEGYPEVSLP